MNWYIYNYNSKIHSFKDKGYDTAEMPMPRKLSAFGHDNLKLTIHNAFTAWCNRESVIKRRACFIKTLEECADSDIIILSDAAIFPILPADRLEELIVGCIEKYPKVGVIRLSMNDTPEAKESDVIEFEKFSNQHHFEPDKCLCIQPLAFVVLPDYRKKLASLLRISPYPVEVVLESASLAHDVPMCVPNFALVHQTANAEMHYTITVPNIWRKRKIALMLASYTRLEDAARQIHMMMNQSYDEDSFHLFVALKGIPEFIFHEYFLPYFKKYIEAGRLTIRYYPNRTQQLMNLLDTVRDLDTSEYDLFLKIDDDDFYHVDYVRTINDFHMYVPDTVNFLWYGAHIDFFRRRGMLTVDITNDVIFGGTLCMTRPSMELLFESETNLDLVKSVQGSTNIAYCEDMYIRDLSLRFGRVNINPYLRVKGIERQFYMMQKGNASVSRGGLVPEDVRYFRNLEQEPNYREEVVFMSHPSWNDTVRIFRGEAMRSRNGDKAKILQWDGTTLKIKWYKYGEETFVKQENGAYVLN